MPKKKRAPVVDLAEQRRMKKRQKRILELFPMYKAALELASSPFGEEFRDLVKNADTYQREAQSLYEAATNSDLHKLDAYLKKKPPRAGVIASLIMIAERNSRYEQARRGGQKKAESSNVAAKAVRQDWEKHHGSYKSKAEFSRIWSPRLKREYGIDVTARTIERAWLPKADKRTTK